MFRRFLFAGLASLVFAFGAMADQKVSEEHQFEANFPGTAEQLVKPFGSNGKVVILSSNDDDRLFMMGAAMIPDAPLSPEQYKSHAREFIGGATGNLKNSKIVKEGDLKPNDETRVGYAYMVQHDNGVQFHWVTIENGKLYFVTVHANSKEAMKTDVVKRFIESAKVRRAESGK
ncbi:MAG: hypothetical protein QM703_27435 [Gemmatales bacterium]